jgi:hypothetical protein
LDQLTTELGDGHSVYLTASIAETGGNESIPALDFQTIDLCGFDLSITDVPADDAAIEVPAETSLTIEDTSSTVLADQGTLTAEGGGNGDELSGGGAGIGGDGASTNTSDNSGGSVTIDGGTVIATGGSGYAGGAYDGGGAGIGGGGGGEGYTNTGGDSSTITLAAGAVTATGGSGGYYDGGGGAGIGGGGASESNGDPSTGGNAGAVTVSGASVTAVGGAGSKFSGAAGAGVGGGGGGAETSGTDTGGAASDVSVSAGSLTATGGSDDLADDPGAAGAGIGGGGGAGTSANDSVGGDGGAGATVTLTGGTTSVTGGTWSSNATDATTYQSYGIGPGGNGGSNTADDSPGTVAVSGTGTSTLYGLGQLAAPLTVASGATLDVPADQYLIFAGNDDPVSTNNGTIDVAGIIAGGIDTLDNANVIKTVGSDWGVGPAGPNPGGGDLALSGNFYEFAFDVGAGSGTPPSDIYVFAPTVADSGQSLPAGPTAPSGQWFTGWFDSENAQVKNTSSLSGFMTVPGADTLTAHYGTATAPVITAKVTSAHAKTKYGWYGSKVTVAFTCSSPGAGSTLTASCPKAVVLSKNGSGQSVTKKITAVDGKSASVTVKKINIDTTKPSVTIKGAKAGKTYRTIPHLTCSAKDRFSGIASCRLHTKRSGKKVTVTATATSKAGLTATKTIRFKLG